MVTKGDASKPSNVTDKIWDLLSSVKFAIIIFTLIALTSIIGTVIEQRAEPAKTIEFLSKIFGSSAPTAYRIIDTLGFTDMYRSWWFLALLFLFSANLILCSIDRLPRIWKAVKEPINPIPPDIFNSMPIKRETSLKGKTDKAKELVESALKKVGFKPSVYNDEAGMQIFAEKWKESRLGVYVTHFSIIIILIGSVIGIFFGFNGGLNLLEGTTSSVAYVEGGKAIPLGFTIRCDDFEVLFYEGTDTPKEFKSWLTVIENGKEVMKKEIEVNVPLRYKGITFYQSSYGFNPTKDSLFKFTVRSKDGKKEDVQIKFEESFVIPGTNIKGIVKDFSPALGMDPSGRLFTYAEMMNNPAVLIEFTENDKKIHSQWVLKRYPQTWKITDERDINLGIVEFHDLWGSQFTGLQVRKDPGVWIVYLGCLIMGIGLYAAFFMSHQRVWVRLKEDKNSVKISIAASTNKNRAALEQKIDKLIKLINQ